MPHVSESFHRFGDFILQSERYQEDWREDNQSNFQMYDGNQWDPEDFGELEKRGQQATVLNITRPTIDTIMSLENQQRTDLQIVGREASDLTVADTLTEALKQVYDQNDYNYYQAQVFREGLIGGIGWLEASIDEDESGEEQISVNKVPWEEMFWDPFMRKPDGTDARFISRRVWMDEDQAKDTWPKMAQEIEQEVARLETIADEDFQGQEHEAQTDSLATHFFNSDTKRVGVHDMWYTDAKGKWHKVIFLGRIFLEGSEEDSDNKSPFESNFCPFIPYIASRDKDGLPLGVVQIIRSIQETLNKVNSKYLWTISARQVIMEAGAAKNPEEIREESSKPDGVMILEPGAMAAGRFQLNTNFNESTHLMAMMNFLIAMAQRVSGINDALQGQGGVNARTAQQEASRLIQGSQLQSGLVENLFFTKRQMAKVIIRLIAQVYDGERIIRITQPDGSFEFRPLGTTFDEDGKETKLDNIEDILRYDVVLREVSPFSTVRQHTLSMFVEAAKAGALPPDIASRIILELSDIPNKERFISELQEQQKQAGAQAAAAGIRQFPQVGGAAVGQSQ